MGKERFTNAGGISVSDKSFSDFRQWQKERRAKKKDLSYQVPQAASIELEQIGQNREEPSITWIGHSTFLIQMGGLNVLTDPVWASRMGFQKRLAPPGISLVDMPAIDVVLLSHSHYDHLHFGTLRRLKGDPLFIVPIGLADKLRRKGYRSVIELRWWEEHVEAGIRFAFVPAQHWSKRTLWDTNTSHWGGFVMEQVDAGARGRPVYFAGDSGYFDGFKEIGEKYRTDIVLMPIGAYEPEWFMGGQHVTPEEAVQAFMDCRGKLFIPMHYGAFRLADDTPKEALDRLSLAWDNSGLSKEMLKQLMHGETYWGRG